MKAELKVVRLVRRSLDQAVVPFVFDEVSSRLATRILRLRTSPLLVSASYIKIMITLCFLHYPDYSKEIFLNLGPGI